MKNTIVLLLFFLFTQTIWAQVPQKMSYQAIIRNENSELVANTSVGVKISLLQNTATGTAVYVETHTTQTNENGLLSLQIGNGTVNSGVFSAINWANGPYFIKTETDPTGGNSYSIVGVTELLSVPYALASGQSVPTPGNAIGDMQYWNGTTWTLLPLGAPGQVLKVTETAPQWTTPSQVILSTVTTDTVSEIKAKKATVSGTVTNTGGEFVIARGFCFALNTNPTVGNRVVTAANNDDTGIFSAELNALTANSTYYVRAFTTTIAGTSYGSTLSFTTTNGIAVINTIAATDIIACGFKAGISVTSDGGDTIENAGICFGTNSVPTITDNPQNGGETYGYIFDITTNQANTLYYYRAFAQNSTGVYYGAILSFTTQNTASIFVINPATNIKSCSVSLSMTITPSLLNTLSSYGVVYSTATLPTIEDTGVGLDASYVGTATCLSENTTYYARSYTNNCNGLTYGNQITFTTSNNSATVTTNAPNSISTCTIVVPLNTIQVGDGSCISNLNGLV